MRWWGGTLPTTAPRLIMSPNESDSPSPVRIYSDATRGEGGGLAGPIFLSVAERPRPILLRAKANEKLRSLAATSNAIYIFELSAPIAAMSQLCDELRGREAFLPVSNEAACTALTKGAAKNKVASMLVFTMWSLLAQYDVAIWTGRVP